MMKIYFTGPVLAVLILQTDQLMLEDLDAVSTEQCSTTAALYYCTVLQ